MGDVLVEVERTAVGHSRRALPARILLIAEFVALFVAAPVALFLKPRHIPPLPILWLAAGYGLLVLWRDPTFDRRQLWNQAAWKGSQREIWTLFAIGAVLLTGLTLRFAPASLLALVRQHPLLWVLIMVLYPLLSVYPQGILYRAFFLHRYRHFLPGGWIRVVVSAAAFSLMHIVFRNPVALGLTFVGGVVFAKRYEETRSLCVSSYEHALYGCFLFTVGLGSYFYTKAV